jgi:hypothetical protein
VGDRSRAISSSKLLGLQLVVFQWVRNPLALMYFFWHPPQV